MSVAPAITGKTVLGSDPKTDTNASDISSSRENRTRGGDSTEQLTLNLIR